MTDSTDPQVPEPVVLPVPPELRRSAILPLVAGGILAAVIGFTLAQVLPAGWRGGDTSALQAQLDTQTSELAALKAAVAQLSAAPEPDTALSDRIGEVEDALAGVPDLAPLASQLDALDQSVTALKAQPDPTGQIDTTALSDLQADVAALKSGGLAASAEAEVSAVIDAKLAGATAKVDAIKAEAEAIAAAAIKRAALHQIVAALDSGAPYSSAVADLADAELPPELADHAPSGLPTLQSLRLDFPDAARAALDAAITASMGDTWTERATAFLRGQTGARSLTPREGNDPDAVLSRAEAAMGAGDLGTALAELTALPTEGQSAMADWRARAELHQAAARQVQTLIEAFGK